jgi:hypothetical protein
MYCVVHLHNLDSSFASLDVPNRRSSVLNTQRQAVEQTTWIVMLAYRSCG